GAQVDEILVYATVMPEGADTQSFTAMLAKVDTVIFTSPSGARNAHTLLGGDLELLKDKRLVAIGPVTGGAMAKLGMTAHLTAQEYTDQGIMEILQRSKA
ncbi:MAG: uroporphyrinogen-III synthase, partial [Syntrophaceae bacterium]